MTREALESGALLPVLKSASHEALAHIVTALNNGWDVFITWDARYKAARHDLTANPALIAEYICRAGGHPHRGYDAVVRDASRAVGARIPPGHHGVVAQEAALLCVLIERMLARLTPAARADVERHVRQTAGNDTGIGDILTGGAQMALLLPMVFATLAGMVSLRGAIGDSVGRGVGMGVFRGLLASSGLAGPSYSATIPAVVCVALLRQRLLWREAASV